jgi:hypothetical protein
MNDDIAAGVDAFVTNHHATGGYQNPHVVYGLAAERARAAPLPQAEVVEHVEEGAREDDR